MKLIQSVLFVLLLTGLSIAGAQGQCPDPGGCYTDRLTYEIMNADGAVVDRTVYERLVPIPYTDAMELKYLRMLNKFGGAAQTWLQVKSAGGISRALSDAVRE